MENPSDRPLNFAVWSHDDIRTPCVRPRQFLISRIDHDLILQHLAIADSGMSPLVTSQKPRQNEGRQGGVTRRPSSRSFAGEFDRGDLE
jgi:hypothetical protein